jgi:hypothetical protein
MGEHVQQVENASQAGGSMGSGADLRTRRILGAVLALVLVAAVAAVFISKRDPIEDRKTLPSCGSTTAAVDGTVPPASTACFDAALGSDRGAELRVVSYTQEGDPIVSYYRALPGGGAEVLIDNTQDNFGTQGWGRRTCPKPVSLEKLGDCSFEDF